MPQLLVYGRSCEVFDCIGIKEEHIFHTFIHQQEESFSNSNLIKSFPELTLPTKHFYDYHFKLAMRSEKDDPMIENQSEKNLPFRKRLNKRQIPEQYEASHTSDVPLNLPLDKTENEILGSSEIQDLSDTSSNSCDRKSSHSRDQAKCHEDKSASVTVGIIQSRESKEEETLIPSTVESLPSTSSGVGKKTSLTCTHCQKVFHHRGDMNKHLRTHTKEQPYSCRYCPSKFSHASNLHRHERMHTGVKPYSCINCDKTFSRADKFRLHKMSKYCKNKKNN